jgi:O-antigen ligase
LRLLHREFPTRQLQLFFVSACLIFIGFVCSRLLVSLGMIGFLLSGFSGLSVAGLRKKVAAQPEYLILTLLYWLVFISGIYSDDSPAWSNFLRIHIPYLLMPLAFIMMPAFRKVQLYSVLVAYVLVMFTSASVVLVNYVLHFDQINVLMKQGISIPTPFSHIRYSLMVVFGFWAAVFLAMEVTGRTARLFLGLAGLFLFIMIHLLAVRSGIFALYSCILMAVFVLLIRKRMYIYGVVILASMVLLPMMAYKYVPSLQTRVGYMLYDLQNYRENKTIDASDGMRLRSWGVAVQVVKNDLWLGVGYGDMQQKMNEYYEAHFPELWPAQRKLPHNQWIWMLLATGIVGLAVFVFATIYPWYRYRASRNWLWHFFFIILLGSFMWEATLEEQMGTALFMTWLCIFLNSETVARNYES